MLAYIGREPFCLKVPALPDRPSPSALPSREAILEFIARESASVGKEGAPHSVTIGKREIAKAFDLKGADKIALKQLLRAMADEGLVAKSKRLFAKASPETLPVVTLAIITGRDRDGEWIGEPAEHEGSGPLPKILILPPAKGRGRGAEGPAPGIGDRVLVRIQALAERAKGDPAYTGRIVKIMPRRTLQVLGVFRRNADGSGRILPVDKKGQAREMIVPQAHCGEAQDGDLVTADLLRGGRFDARLGPPAAKVRERLGSMNNERAISLIAIHSHDIPHIFPDAVLKEAERAKPLTMRGTSREDWRDLPLLTIDPADAKDHDDAVHAFADSDPANAGGFVVTVAIADVAAYVRPGTGLDREALVRGNSVYFPDRVVPMLPERISNDLCSLRPLEDRPALAVRMVLSNSGAKLRHSFHRMMMRSAAKLSYQQAQDAFDGNPDPAVRPLMQDVLLPLLAAYRVAAKARDERAPLDLDLPERKLVLKTDGTVDRVIVPPRLEAHRLIEEFMILANVAAAETLEQARQILIYRAHDVPSVEKLNALSEFLATLGIKLAKGEVLKPAKFNAILGRVRGTPQEGLVNEVVLRSQAQAEYVHENYGHFGLNLRRYAHFTSPIRRYADLIVHRALIRALKLGDDGLPDLSLGELSDIASSLSVAERRAMVAERETTDRLIATFLADQTGAVFAGRIAGVTRVGLFVKLNETGADGFIPAATLGSDYYRYEERSHSLVGNRTGQAHRLGDQVEVRLVEAAPFAGALRFELLGKGSQAGRVGPRKSAVLPARDNRPSGFGAKSGAKNRVSRRRQKDRS